ncbi:hypothetical protein PFISCL1PPCAC_24108, partial [Pristionchus fissidentatus]
FRLAVLLEAENLRICDVIVEFVLVLMIDVFVLGVVWNIFLHHQPASFVDCAFAFYFTVSDREWVSLSNSRTLVK